MPVNFTGNWDILGEMAGRLSKNFPKYADNVTAQGCTFFLNQVKNKITSQQGTNWTLSPHYQKLKEAQGKGTKVWINSGKFMKKLEVRKLGKGVYFAGAPADVMYDENLSMAKLALLGEYGTRHESPKPLFGPARRETEKPLMNFITEETKTLLIKNSYAPKELKSKSGGSWRAIWITRK